MALDLPDVDIQAELALAEKGQAVPEEKVEAADVPLETSPEEKVEPAETPGDKPEEKTEAKTEEKVEKKGDPTVALRLARKEAKELKEQLRRKEVDDSEKYRVLQERLDRLQNPPAEKPAFEIDPANFLKNEVDDLKKQSGQIAEQTQQQRIEGAIAERLQSSEASFAKEHPDYVDAAQHMVKTISANMAVIGVDEALRGRALKQEIFRLTAAALKAGKEPAEMIYELAKNQGFVPKAAVAGKENAEKLATIAKGQEASGTLGSGSRSDAGKLTLDSLAKMDDDDFNALVLDDKKWAQVGQLMH